MTNPDSEPLHVLLSNEELEAVDTWRSRRHLPSRSVALRELLKRGLSVEGFQAARSNARG